MSTSVVTPETAATGLTLIRQMADVARAGMSKSLIDYTRPARVEPICLIDSDCLYADGLSDMMNTALALFSGFYLQAAALSMTVGRVEVMRQLDKLNPNRSAKDSGLDYGGWLLAQESYKDRLPSFSDTAHGVAAMEDEHDRYNVSFGNNVNNTIQELQNLSVGKILNVEIKDGNNSATIPISVRLMASSIPTNSLLHILSQGSTNETSAKERYHAWRAGRLEFIKDIVLCRDLIDAHRKNLMKDMDNVYSNIVKRARGNQLAAIVSANPSVATASNIVIMSDTTAAELEMKLNGRLSNFNTRQKVFDETYMMMMMILDKSFNQVTIYFHGMSEKMEMNIKDLKSANKNSGANITDILKAFQMGHAPSL